jgi:hypothetical protein
VGVGVAESDATSAKSNELGEINPAPDATSRNPLSIARLNSPISPAQPVGYTHADAYAYVIALLLAGIDERRP